MDQLGLEITKSPSSSLKLAITFFFLSSARTAFWSKISKWGDGKLKYTLLGTLCVTLAQDSTIPSRELIKSNFAFSFFIFIVVKQRARNLLPQNVIANCEPLNSEYLSGCLVRRLFNC